MLSSYDIPETSGENNHTTHIDAKSTHYRNRCMLQAFPISLFSPGKLGLLNFRGPICSRAEIAKMFTRVHLARFCEFRSTTVTSHFTICFDQGALWVTSSDLGQSIAPSFSINLVETVLHSRAHINIKLLGQQFVLIKNCFLERLTCLFSICCGCFSGCFSGSSCNT